MNELLELHPLACLVVVLIHLLLLILILFQLTGSDENLIQNPE